MVALSLISTGPSIYRNSKRHWSGVVHDSNDRALQALRDVSEDLFAEYCTDEVTSAEDEQAAANATRAEKWARIQAMATANSSAAAASVAPLPNVPTACPDIFMKGENISPHRQANRRVNDAYRSTQHRQPSITGVLSRSLALSLPPPLSLSPPLSPSLPLSLSPSLSLYFSVSLPHPPTFIAGGTTFIAGRMPLWPGSQDGGTPIPSVFGDCAV